MATAAKKMSKEEREKATVVTPKFRVSYPHVFKAQAPKPTDKPKYSITMLLPKTADLSKVKAAINQAKINQFGEDKSKWPKGLLSPVADGDDPKNATKEGYAGCWVIKATSNEEQKPVLVDTEGEPILAQADFYPGCYARANIYARCWEYMGKQGVQFILDHVQKLADGKPFGGKKPVDQVFAPVNAGDFDEAEESHDFM